MNSLPEKNSPMRANQMNYACVTKFEEISGDLFSKIERLRRNTYDNDRRRAEQIFHANLSGTTDDLQGALQIHYE